MPALLSVPNSTESPVDSPGRFSGPLAIPPHPPLFFRSHAAIFLISCHAVRYRMAVEMIVDEPAPAALSAGDRFRSLVAYRE